METWQLFLGLSGVMVLFAVLVSVMDTEVTIVDVGYLVVFSAAGLYLGDRISKRLEGG